MSERLDSCPKCTSFHIRTVRILNPETTDLNAKAELECGDCKNNWIGTVTSPHYREMKRRI